MWGGYPRLQSLKVGEPLADQCRCHPRAEGRDVTFERAQRVRL